MSLDRTKSSLEILKPLAKAVPVAGPYLEGVVDLVLEGCKLAEVRDMST